MRPVLCSTLGLMLVVAGCAAGSREGSNPTTDTFGLSDDPVLLLPIEEAVAVNLAVTDEVAAVGWITHEAVMVATLDPETDDLMGPTPINGQVTPIAHPIERPALRVDQDGTVDVAFTSHGSDGASVYLVADGGEPALVSGAAHHETNLVHMTSDANGDPLLAWLEDSTLSVGRTEGVTLVELELVDDLTCDCCNPVPIVVDGGQVVAYRDLDTVDGEMVRNVAAVRSPDDVSPFADPVQIADDDWFLTGCPFSGPSVASNDKSLIVAWADARQSVHPDQAESSIWVDSSTDGGVTFGTDVTVTSQGLNRWPALAIDTGGGVHLVWETGGPDGGLSYAVSNDGGLTFSDPRLLIGRTVRDEGAPHSPSVAVFGDRLLVTWADDSGGYLAAWSLG